MEIKYMTRIIPKMNTAYWDLKKMVKENQRDSIYLESDAPLIEFYNYFTKGGTDEEKIKLFNDFFSTFEGTQFGVSFSLWDGYITEPGFAAGGDSSGPYYSPVYGRCSPSYDGHQILEKFDLDWYYIKHKNANSDSNTDVVV